MSVDKFYVKSLFKKEHTQLDPLRRANFSDLTLSAF
jgi:hypothetical protein